MVRCGRDRYRYVGVCMRLVYLTTSCKMNIIGMRGERGTQLEGASFCSFINVGQALNSASPSAWEKLPGGRLEWW